MGAEIPQAPPPPRALNANVNPSHIPNLNPILAMGRGGGGVTLYSWRTGVLVPFFKD